MTRKLAPIHPGEVLLHDFLEALDISQYRLALDISVPARRVNEIVHGKRAVSADTALRLARYFGTTDRFWLNLQVRYDLDVQRDHRSAVLAETEDRSSQDMVLSLVVPGLGQWTQGRRVAAATQFVTVIGYLAASIAGAGGRAWWLAFAWSAWSAVDAYRHGRP